MVCTVSQFVAFVTLRREEGEEQMFWVMDDVIEQFVVEIGADVGEGW